jgi:hypothetical protein
MNIKEVTLKELDIGDRLIRLVDLSKRNPVYEVLGKPEFNSGHGSATRECKNMHTGERVSKSCRLKVIQLPIQQNNTNEQ